MARNPPPLTLADRVRIAADAVRVIRQKKDHLVREESYALDTLARVEAEVLGKADGWQDATLSGLITENAYAPQPEPAPAPAPKPVKAKKESD